MTFYPGQEVVYEILSGEGHPWWGFKEGGVYTVSECRGFGELVGLRFIDFPPPSIAMPSFFQPENDYWNSKNFRPLVKRKTDISIFTNMLDDPSHVPVGA